MENFEKQFNQPKLSEESKNHESKQETPLPAEISPKPSENLDESSEDQEENQEKAKNKEKDLKLEEIRQEVENIGDRLGKPIDEGIKETVVMFKANELPTSDSCEGHIERGLPVPYVEVSAPNEPEERFVGQNEAFEKVAKKYNLTIEEVKTSKIDEAYWEAMKECSQNKETEEYKKWNEENEKLLVKGRGFLEEFYKDRKVEPNVKLQIEEGVGNFRIHNGGEDYQPVIEEEREFSEEEKKARAEKIEKYRAEMREFTKFLKEKYFGHSSEKVNLEAENHEIKGERLIEYSQKVGSFYTSFIESLTKMGEAKNEILNELPDEIRNKFKGFIESINKNSQLQHVRFFLKEDGAKDLLSKLAERRGLDKELIDDKSKYELEEMSPGIFVIFMNKDLYSKFHGENVAVATLERDDVSFISMSKEYREEKFRNNLYKENLLHESHHIVWSFLLREGKINIKEADKDKQMGYRFFQDEVIARLCSEGGMMSYSHFLLMDKESLKEFTTQNPQKEEQINKQVANLNTLMYDEIIPLMNEVGLKKQDLIFSVMEAQNFVDLENNLKKIKTVIEQKVEKSRKSKL